MRLPAKVTGPVAKLLEQLTHTADGMFAVDPQQRILVWNKGAEALLGYSAEEALGKPCCEIVQGRDCNGVLYCVPHCPRLEQGKKLRWVHHMEIQSRSKNGQDLWISVTTVSVASARGKLSALVHLFRPAEQTMSAPTLSGGSSPSAAEELMRTSDRRNAPTSPFPLSDREMEVLLLMAEGLTTKEISAQLSISSVTVRNHTQHILRKLAVHSRVEAILWALRRRA